MENGTQKGMRKQGFGFSLEAELLLARAGSFEPLWYRDLQFDHLCGVLESISLEGLPAMEALPIKPPHRLALPYFVAGYELHDRDSETVSLLPKGVGIRTGLSGSISDCLQSFDELEKRLQKALADVEYQAVALPYHPVEERFQVGPKEGRPYGEWMSAVQSMLSYDLSLNIQVPEPLLCELAPLDEIEARINHYMPALVGLGLASPLHGGKLWVHEGQIGRGVRTYKQSGYESPMVTRPQSPGLFEFKAFEMNGRTRDYHAYLLLCLALLVDPDLKGRTTDARRALDMIFVATGGLDGNMQSRAQEVFDGAFRILPRLGLDPAPLEALTARLESGKVPADEIIASFRFSKSIPSVLKEICRLVPENESETVPASAVAF